MQNVLTRKLEGFGPLPDIDRSLLDGLLRHVRSIEAREDVIREGEAPANVHLIIEGFACRYKITEGGARQIVALLLPGDFCDLHVFILKAMDHGIAALSACKMVDIPRKNVLEMTESPAITRALWWATLVDEAILRDWLLGMGRRAAEERIAHLFCEMYLRLKAVGLTTDNSFEFPITQSDLADVMGLSSVHVNRALQKLRQEDLILWQGKQLVILDPQRLRVMSGFNPNYLHLAEALTS